METLNDSTWDVVIAGTGLHEALLALALSRSDLKILHVDKARRYGGEAAALGLQDAREWAGMVNGEAQDQASAKLFSNASIQTLAASENATGVTLGPPRKYSLALAPQLVYARSSLLSKLVSAKVDSQLEFLAMGSWWLCDSSKGDIVKVPNSREDMLADDSLDARSKRSMIKFLRLAANFEQEEDTWRPHADTAVAQFLEQHFGIKREVQQPLGALAMSLASTSDTQTEFCIRRIARHLRSLNVFGPNFGAVLSKYGGLAEVSQVACRSCAVGGATYVLGQGIAEETIEPTDDLHAHPVRLTLTNGDKIASKRIVYGEENMPETLAPVQALASVSRLICILSSPLHRLFPSLGDESPSPAGATVRVSLSREKPPITVIVHSSDTGECPIGQSVCYTSMLGRLSERSGMLKEAMELLLSKVEPDARILWSLQYEQICPDELKPADITVKHDGRAIVFPAPSSDLVFEDEVLQRVEKAWQIVLGPDAESSQFMKFESRGGEEDAGEADEA